MVSLDDERDAGVILDSQFKGKPVLIGGHLYLPVRARESVGFGEACPAQRLLQLERLLHRFCFRRYAEAIIPTERQFPERDDLVRGIRLRIQGWDIRQTIPV